MVELLLLCSQNSAASLKLPSKLAVVNWLSALFITRPSVKIKTPLHSALPRRVFSLITKSSGFCKQRSRHRAALCMAQTLPVSYLSVHKLLLICFRKEWDEDATPCIFSSLLLLILLWKTLNNSCLFLKAARFMCLYRVNSSHLLFSLSQAWCVWLSWSLPEINISSPLIICISLQWLVNSSVQESAIFQMPLHHSYRNNITDFLHQECNTAGNIA